MLDSKVFWDAYQADGILAAMDTVDSDGQPDVDQLRNAVPELIEEAKGRNIDMLVFLKELDEVQANAVGTDNDGGELPVDSSVDTDPVEDADEPAESQDDDGQAGSGSEEAEGSTGV